MANFSKLVLCLIAVLVRLQYYSLAVAMEECIQDYHSLEFELVENDLNLDGLTRCFFPPNTPSTPVVEVVYHISDLNRTYIYRWTETPIYLFIDPFLLERLALHTISFVLPTCR